MLEVHDIRKSYGDRLAVKGVSFEIAPGECVGLLGPNGAGKTTTVSIIAGLLSPDSGRVSIDGKALAGDSDPAKRQLGLVPQELALYEKLSARANLELFGALYGLKGASLRAAIGSALELVGLADRAKDRVGTFSGGMKRRLNLAAALLHAPKWVILDEPTVGVDPQSRNAIFENLEALRRQGTALLYTTHYMEEAERLCDRIVIMDHGAVVAAGTLRELHEKIPSSECLALETPAVEGPWVASLRDLPEVVEANLKGGVLEVDLKSLAATPSVLAKLSEQRIPFTRLASRSATLEDVFLSLTGRSLRD